VAVINHSDNLGEKMSNIVDLNGKRLTSEQVQEQSENADEVKLQALNKDRVQGIERADKALDELRFVRETPSDPVVASTLTHLESAVRGLATSVTALNALFDVIAHDLMQVILGADRTNNVGMMNSLYVQTVMNTLMQKSLVTEQELNATLQNIRQQAMAAAKNPTPRQ
jgi:hypothetical protein